jgi:eukaryotic-like serine/threonine-protein kinase
MAAASALVVLNAFGPEISGHHAALAPAHRDHSTTRPTASKSPASGSSPSSGSFTPSPSRPSFGAQAAVPAGYHRYADPTGFSIAVPDGWAVSRQGTYVYVVPPSGGSFLIIDQTDHPKPDPLADWRQQEANRIGTYPGYHRIRLQAIYYPQAEKAADWEWTYYKNGVLTHVLNRNILANSKHAYALYWSTPQSEWDADFHIFGVFARTFQPAAP